MPFRPQTFIEIVSSQLEGPAQEELAQACEAYAALTTPLQRSRCIHGMMETLDRAVDEPRRREIMEACGQRCITTGILRIALRLRHEANDLDDLLRRLNQAHIGGGRLERTGDVIYAAYDRCYCGSVSHARKPFSPTYCHCSCGWYHRLFETLFEGPVEVELLSSILQGDERCQFKIRIPEIGLYHG